MGKRLSNRLLKRAERTIVSGLLGVGLFLGLAGLVAAAQTPLSVVKDSNEAVLAIFNNNPVVDAAVEKELFAVIDGVTDYAALAAAAIDTLCEKLSAAECATFKETFTRLLRISSIKKLGRYRADRFEYLGEQVVGATGTVRTFAFYKEEKIPLDYQLARRGDHWVIVNYIVDQIDTVRNYRKQFLQLLAKESFDQLIARLNRKITQYETEK